MTMGSKNNRKPEQFIREMQQSPLLKPRREFVHATRAMLLEQAKQDADEAPLPSRQPRRSRSMRIAAVLAAVSGLAAAALGVGLIAGVSDWLRPAVPAPTANAVTAGHTIRAIQERMYNVIDQYSNARGVYRHVSTRRADNVDETIAFQVEQTPAPRSYVRWTRTDGTAEITVFDGNHLLHLDETDRMYTRSDTAPRDRSRSKNSPWHFVDKDGVDNWMHRPDPAWSDQAQLMLNPYTLVHWLEQSPETQVIGRERIVGRDALRLDALLAPAMAQKLQAESYRFWMDEQTGMLLKFEIFNAEGQTVESYEMLELEIDADSLEDKYAVPAEEGWTERPSPGVNPSLSVPK